MAMSTRKKVEIPDKAWLDTLKFLMGSQWLKMRFVSHQLANVVEGNISKLPRIIIDNVKFSDTCMLSKPFEIIASGSVIPTNNTIEWFIKRGINLDPPADLQHKDAIICKSSKFGHLHMRSIYYYADVNDLAGESQTIRPKKGKIISQILGCGSGQRFQEHRKPVLFSAAFNPSLNEYSWASMEYFLNLLYNPLTYIKEIEMYAPNKSLTDAFFLGDDYGSYIRCGKFTIIGDLCKSLPWIQKNVRADTICLPADYTDTENSYKDLTNFLLDTPWICANQNVKTVNIKLEWVRHWKWLIRSLIKKFRTLATIEDHATPSIEFPFYKQFGEILKLNFMTHDPDVVKMKPDDSQGTEAVYVVSNGRNRMEIDIVKRAENMNTFLKLPISYRKRTKDIYDVSIKTYTIDPAVPSRKNVQFLNDTWLEALKFLSFSKWSKAHFVSRQLAGVVQGNISRLPCIVIDSATMSKMTSLRSTVVAFDDKIAFNMQTRFFTMLGISLDAPADVQHENAILGLSRLSPIGMFLRGTAQDLQCFLGQIIFTAQFSKLNKHSWPSLKFFLGFLYYPAIYIEEVKMFALNQKMIDDLFDAKECFIRCGAFTMRGETESFTNLNEFRKSLSWIERNVRANTIHFPVHIDYKNEHIYESIANFLVDASWKCARQGVNFMCICSVDLFVKAVVQKFKTSSFIPNDIPLFMASTYGNDKTLSFLLLDPSVLKLKSNLESADVYLISNGDNRMQIKVVKGNDSLGFEYCYGSRKYHDNRRERNLCKLKVYVKVNSV